MYYSRVIDNELIYLLKVFGSLFTRGPLLVEVQRKIGMSGSQSSLICFSVRGTEKKDSVGDVPTATR